MIPKVIHYCWFGGTTLPISVRACIKSWKEKCPNYEIIEWNESNFDVNAHPFIKAAYEAKAWAFVSDYARLKIVYENGGFYLDTDVELLKSLDLLCENKCYFGVQQDGNFIATGLGFGSEKKNSIIYDMLKEYDEVVFSSAHKQLITCPIINSKVLERYGFIRENSLQKIGDVCIYPSEYFDPLAPGETKNLMNENTISIHHYSATWTGMANKSKRFLYNFIGQRNINNLKIFLKRVRKSNNER